jgi:hypothetical protein
MSDDGQHDWGHDAPECETYQEQQFEYAGGEEDEPHMYAPENQIKKI